MYTDASVGATRSSVWNTARIDGVSPTISPNEYGAAASARSAAASASARSRPSRSRRSSSPRSSFSRTTSGANGFCKKSNAPRRIASTAVSTVPKAVTIIAGHDGSSSRTAFSTSRPPVPSIFRSVMTKSAPRCLNCARPAAPFGATIASWPMRRTVAARPSRIVSLSSMIRTRAIAASITQDLSRRPFAGGFGDRRTTGPPSLV